MVAGLVEHGTVLTIGEFKYGVSVALNCLTRLCHLQITYNCYYTVSYGFPPWVTNTRHTLILEHERTCLIAPDISIQTSKKYNFNKNTQ